MEKVEIKKRVFAHLSKFATSRKEKKKREEGGGWEPQRTLPLPSEITRLIFDFLSARDLRILTLVNNRRRHRKSLAADAKRAYNARFSNGTAAHFIICLDPIISLSNTVHIRRTMKDENVLIEFLADFTCHHIEDIKPGECIGAIKRRLMQEHVFQHTPGTPCKLNISYPGQLIHDESGKERIKDILASKKVVTRTSERCFACELYKCLHDLTVVRMDGLLKQYKIPRQTSAFLRTLPTFMITGLDTSPDIANAFFTEEFATLLAHQCRGNKEAFATKMRLMTGKINYLANNRLFDAVLLCPECAFFRTPTTESISHRTTLFFPYTEIHDENSEKSPVERANAEVVKRRIMK